MSVSTRARFEVLKRDRFRCRYCGAGPTRSTLQVDHVHPVSKGGRDHPSNLVTSCRVCNHGKSNLTLLQAPPLSNDEAYQEFIKGWEACSGSALGDLLRPLGDGSGVDVERIAAAVGTDAETMWSFLQNNGVGVLAWGCVEADDDDAEAARAVVRWLIERAARRYLADQRRTA